MVKATGIDPEAHVEGAIKFAATSGGIFLDMAIHDIDLMRWFLGCEATEVYAQGTPSSIRNSSRLATDETAMACYKFENGAMGFVHVGRTAPHGYRVETEIIGTEGSIRISAIPEKNQAMIFDVHGAVTECVGSFPERFDGHICSRCRSSSTAYAKASNRVSMYTTVPSPRQSAMQPPKHGRPVRSLKSAKRPHGRLILGAA